MGALRTPTPSAAGAPIPVVIYLSGARRGITQRLHGETLRIGTSPEAEIRLTTEGADVPPEQYATLHRRGLTYELEAEPGKEIWVNGERADRMVLASGDVLEIGRGGHILRFRLYRPGTPPYKSITEVFSDCVDCARYGSRSMAARAGIFLRGVPVELATQTSHIFRGTVVVALIALVTSTVVLVRRSVELEQRLASEQMRVAGLAELLDRSRENPTSAADVSRMLDEVEANLTATAERLEALEARSGAAARVIAQAARSTAFLQGSYGFLDGRTGEPMRLVVDPDGTPLTYPTGEPIVTTEGDGPVFEAYFTGTGFIVTGQGLLLSNRHVGIPWDYDPAALRVRSQGWQPVMRRFVAYLPGLTDPFPVELVMASDEADVAVFRCSGVTGTIPALRLSNRLPRPGDEVLVLGYPLGIRALMARTEREFVERLQRESNIDFWTAAARLSEGGHIAPLASRGIVGQVTSQAVVYDAETTHGGSGGPVLTLSGDVIAINAAVLPEFGGSNLGVPAEAARTLLSRLPR